jgi:hypothetical protein
VDATLGLLKNLGLVIGRAKMNVFLMRAVELTEGLAHASWHLYRRIVPRIVPAHFFLCPTHAKGRLRGKA